MALLAWRISQLVYEPSGGGASAAA